MKACSGDQGDSFRIVFPQGTTAENKALLMAAAVFLDYIFFEKGSEGDQISQNWIFLSNIVTTSAKKNKNLSG